MRLAPCFARAGHICSHNVKGHTPFYTEQTIIIHTDFMQQVINSIRYNLIFSQTLLHNIAASSLNRLLSTVDR